MSDVQPDPQLVVQYDFIGSGTIAALNATVVAATQGCSTVFFNVTGTWSATLLIEGQDSDGNWITLQGILPESVAATNSLTANAPIFVPCGGCNQVRLRAFAYTSGTATVSWNSGLGVNYVNQGVPLGVTSAWPIKVTDGTNVSSVTAKGTQGSEALSTQDLKDAGRSYVTLSALGVASVATEALVSFVANTAGTTVAAATSYTVPAGKTFRIQSFSFTALGSGTSADSIFRVRAVASGGTLSATSPLLAAGRGTYNLSNDSPMFNCGYSDGLELPAGSIIGMTHGGATGNTEDMIIVGYLY